MLFHIITVLIRVMLSLTIVAGFVKLWVKQPEISRRIEKRREARRTERARWAESEAWLSQLVLDQQEWFDRAYHKVPAPWRATHRAN
jgi:deoxyadenosine/deoxycytidine kinase